MNDRFKFRVWDKQNECYAYSNNSDVDMLYIETDGELTYGVWDGNTEDMFYIPESEVIVEQCTGLKDKNGKLIYENDIVTDGKDTGHIFWKEDVGGFAVTMFLFQKRPNELEVVGNVHENNELMEV